MKEEEDAWRSGPDLFESLDKLDAIELGDEDLIDTGGDYEEGYGEGVFFVPMLERSWAKWMALVVAAAMIGGVAYLGLRVILDWLGN